MQAIQTKIIPATNTKPTRIKAWAQRGSLTVSVDRFDGLWTDESTHAGMARLLCEQFCADDAREYGSKPESNPWNRPFVSGCIPSGDWVHVFTP